MEAKKEIIQIETFYEYGKDKELEHVEIRVHIDGEIVHMQRMNPLMYRLDNSPIQQFLSWVKGDGRRDKKLEDYWKEVRYSVNNRKGDSWISRPVKPLEKHIGCNSSWEISLTEADRELIQKMIDAAIGRLREEEKRKQEFFKMMEDAKHGKLKDWF